MNYTEYLTTVEWQRTRRWALDRAGNKCQLCKSDRKLDVHHNDYSRLGKEEPSDIIVLCNDCHGHHHRIEKLTEDTFKLKDKPGTPFYKEIQKFIDMLPSAKDDTEIKSILREIDLINRKKIIKTI